MKAVNRIKAAALAALLLLLTACQSEYGKKIEDLPAREGDRTVHIESQPADDQDTALQEGEASSQEKQAKKPLKHRKQKQERCRYSPKTEQSPALLTA